MSTRHCGIDEHILTQGPQFPSDIHRTSAGTMCKNKDKTMVPIWFLCKELAAAISSPLQHISAPPLLPCFIAAVPAPGLSAQQCGCRSFSKSVSQPPPSCPALLQKLKNILGQLLSSTRRFGGTVWSKATFIFNMLRKCTEVIVGPGSAFRHTRRSSCGNDPPTAPIWVLCVNL
eukprot:1161942-Pelagomonas_calceolata.AAC.17